MTPSNQNIKPGKLTWLAILLAIGIAAAARLLPHPLNFTPIGALALFCGATMTNRKWAFLLPIGGLLLSDILMEIVKPGTGFYPGMTYVYGSFFLVILLGVLMKSSKPLNILLASVAGSVLFFVITNFGMWYGSGFYQHTTAGLVECYTAAVPFFRNTLFGDLFFNTVFFGGFYLASRRLSLQRA